jgi:hypothetical protein
MKTENKDTLLAFFDKIKKIKDDQRLLILVTHGFIELLFNLIIDKKCKHGKRKITSNNRDYPFSVKMVLLNEMGLIDDWLYKIIDRFRRLRNRAAHEPFFKLKSNDLNFLEQSIKRFYPRTETINNYDLHAFYLGLIGSIWNTNLEILRPVFLPSCGNIIKNKKSN